MYISIHIIIYIFNLHFNLHFQFQFKLTFQLTFSIQMIIYMFNLHFNLDVPVCALAWCWKFKIRPPAENRAPLLLLLLFYNQEFETTQQ